MEDILKIISTAVSIGATETLKNLGIHSGELSERQALKIYGSWLKEAIANRDVTPCRIGDGKTGTRWYDVADILQYKLSRQVRRVELKFK